LIQAAAYCNVKRVMASGKINFLLLVNSNETSYLILGFLIMKKLRHQSKCFVKFVSV
jgi:hypothetical protein